jgi:hypothetical protein
MYFTGERYAKFIQTIVAQKAAKSLDNLLNVISQDDYDRKQRTQVALDTVTTLIYLLLKNIDNSSSYSIKYDSINQVFLRSNKIKNDLFEI